MRGAPDRHEGSQPLADNPDGKIAHRNASETEAVKWHNALALHKAWGGADEEYFGTPL